MVRLSILIITHCLVFSAGFGIGVYTLPILTAAPSIGGFGPGCSEAEYQAEFRRGLRVMISSIWGKDGGVSSQISHRAS